MPNWPNNRMHKGATALEKRVNERCYCCAAQQYEQTHKKQYNQYRQEPPLFIVFEEPPKFREQRGPLFFGKLVKFAGFFLSRIFRHPFFSNLSKLVEIAVEFVRRSSSEPITFCGGIKLAAKRVTAHQAKEEPKRRQQQKVKCRQQYKADRPTNRQR